jgi:uncharacterized protein (TIGR02246 family)
MQPVTIEFALAECAIRQLHSHYADAVWRLDFDAFGDCFAEDCEWRIGGIILHGRDEIVEYNCRLFTTKFRRLLITLRTPVLEVQGDKASGRTYFSAQNIMADGSAFAPFGVYYEHFVKEDDRWRFKWRLFQTLYSGPPDLSGSLHEQLEFGAPPNMPPLDVETLNVTGLHKD